MVPSMRKVIEYQHRAEDCRRRAAKAIKPEDKKALEEMAAAWELLSKTREKQLKDGAIQPAVLSSFE